MIPLRAETRVRRFSPLVWLIALSSLGAMIRLEGLAPEHGAELIRAMAVVPTRLLESPLGQSATLLTSAFLHVGWLHLAGNLLFLAVFGPTIEARLGWKRFAALYFGCAASAALAHALLHPTSSVPLVGASGAIAGVLGAHIVMEPKARVTTLVPAIVVFELASLPAAFVIGGWFLVQVASTLALDGTASAESIAWTAHVAGFGSGAVAVAPTAIRESLKRAKTRRSRVKPKAGSRSKRAA